MGKLFVALIITLALFTYVKTNINIMDFIDAQINEFTSSIFDFDLAVK